MTDVIQEIHVMGMKTLDGEELDKNKISSEGAAAQAGGLIQCLCQNNIGEEQD